jgi:molecular chaperone GrpE
VLERHGVKRISPKGEKFDPNLHQAVAQAPGDQPAGHVLEVAQPGFVIGERVLRAAMVVVSTGPAAPEPPPLVSDAPPGERFDKRI